MTAADGDRVELSLVVPMLNEEGNVRNLLERVVPVLESTGETFEVIFVDDGSTDDTPLILRQLAVKEPRLRVVRLARNFGQEPAVQAGMLRSRGRWVIQTDGDLQNPPEEIPKLLAKRDEGYEIVFGKREKRKDPPHRVLASKLMVWFMRSVLGIQLPEDITTFRVIDGDLARFIAGLPEKRKFFSALITWSGAKAVSIPVAHSEREAGTTKYNLGKLINHTFDLMVGFSTRPLRLIGVFGAVCALLGGGYGIVRIAMKIAGVPVDAGYTSIFAAIVIMGGLILISLSVIGEYVGRIFEQIQDRPLFRVAEELGAYADAKHSHEPSEASGPRSDTRPALVEPAAVEEAR